MKKTTKILLLTAALAATVALSSCNLPKASSLSINDNSKTVESTTISAASNSTQKLSTSQLYDYFAQHGSSLNALIEKGTFTKNNVDDSTIIHFSLLELIQKSKNQLKSGKIDQTTYDTRIQEFYKDEVNQIATNFFGKEPSNYDTDYSLYAAESGGIVPEGVLNSNEIRFLPTESKNENSVYNTTFNVYSFGSNYRFEESDVKLGDSKLNSQIIGTVSATYTMTVNKNDNSSYITFEKFAFTKTKS